MHILDSLEHSKITIEILVKDISLMDVFHYVCSNDGMKVGFHEIKYQVDVFVIFSFKDIDKGHNVGMTVQLLKENHLASKMTTSR